MENKQWSIAKWFAVGLVCLILSGCGGGSRSLFTRTLDENVSLNTVAVLPYHIVRAPAGEVMVRSPLSADMFRTGTVEEGAEIVLTDLLTEKFKSKPWAVIIPRSEVSDVINEALHFSDVSMGPAHVLKVGRTYDTDGILLGFIYIFRDRLGTAYSVDTAASVSFDLYLLDSDTGRVIWKASYTRTQQPVTDNVLDLEEYFSSGIKWMKAVELARLGMDKMMEKFPKIGR